MAEAISRDALGLAGARRATGGWRIFLKDWSVDIESDRHRLRAVTADFSVDLHLTAQKPPVPHGDRGYSRKGDDPAGASCYYSLTRLSADGVITTDGDRHRVSGTAWMNHEYSTAPLPAGTVGWDWFSLQLDDGTELMAYFLRRKGGGFTPASAGTLVLTDGEAVHLSRSDLRLMVTNQWKSPDSGAVYPAGRRLAVPARGLRLTITPRLADQEMRTPMSTGVTYYEGSVMVSGTGNDGPVKGHGYVELTGYAAAFDAPM